MNAKEKMEAACEWLNHTTKSDAMAFATNIGIDIGQDRELLDEGWNERLTEAYAALIV